MLSACARDNVSETGGSKICAPGVTQCMSGGTQGVERCSADGTLFVFQETCSDEAPCASGQCLAFAAQDAVDADADVDVDVDAPDASETMPEDAPRAGDVPETLDAPDPTDAPDASPPPDTCSPDCASKACGDDGCGGSCGSCAPGSSCVGWSCEPDETGACTNPGDSAILEAGNLAPVAYGCATDCAEQPESCLTDCLVQKTGVSAACAQCYSDTFDCLVANCLPECVQNPAALKCLNCLKEKGCTAALESCTGVEAQ